MPLDRNETAALHDGTTQRLVTRAARPRVVVEPTMVWGLPLAPFTRDEAADAVIRLAEGGRPAFFITANVHYAMLSASNPALAEVNERAAFLLADGKPLVWASQAMGGPLPERVAGSDLIYDVCDRAAARGMSVYLLGAEPGVARAAGERLRSLYPGLRVVGAESTPYRELTPSEHAALIGRVRAAAPDLLFVAFGQPKGELWLSRNYKALGVPACVQLGASFDFVAGRIRRAPQLLQTIGLEWAYRIYSEPARLAPRYAQDALFVLKVLWKGMTNPLDRHARKAVAARQTSAAVPPPAWVRQAAPR